MNKGDPETIEDEESSIEAQAWIQWFCDLEGHEFFAEVGSDTTLTYSRSMTTTSEITLISMDLRLNSRGSGKLTTSIIDI